MGGPLRNRYFALGLAASLGIGIIISLFFASDLLYGWQQRSYDIFFQTTTSRSVEPDDQIVIIGIDEESLNKLGRISEWARANYARVLDSLTKAKARVVVFDVLLSEPAPGDEELASSIRKAGNVVLPVILSREAADFPAIRWTEPAEDFVRPLGVFSAGALAHGHANISPDRDGVVRSLPIALCAGDNCEPSLALATAARYLRLPEVIQSPAVDAGLPFAGRFIPLSENREMLINYLGELDKIVNFRVVSFLEVLEDRVDSSFFQDKIVLIGAVASGLGDIYWTPVGAKNGVWLHASAIHTILSANFLKPVASGMTIALMLIFSLVVAFFVLRLRVLHATIVSLLLLVLYFLAAFSLFDRGILPNLLYPPLSIVASFAGTAVYGVFVERSEKRKITQTVGRYLSPTVVEKILAAIACGGLKLGGEEQEATILFADVRGFSQISRQMPPRNLVELLNKHISLVIKAVLENDGLINKFGGDSLMAVWNAPVKSQDHALLAIKAALNAQSYINGLSRQETGLRMEFGIGINTGRVLAGNMGSEERLEYTVIGDAVNTAARLADAAPGGMVWIGADTLALVSDRIEARLLDPLKVKGGNQALQAYEVLKIRDMGLDTEGGG